MKAGAKFALATVLLATSMALYVSVDWRLAVASFLLLWFNNVDRSPRLPL